MAFDLLLDQITNDLVISNRDFKFTQEMPEELRQRLGIKLRTFQEEWFIDTTYGVPYMQQIISQARNKEDVDIIMLGEIREEDGVDSVRNYVSTWDKYDRTYSFTADVITSAGNIPIAILTQPDTEWIYPDSGDQNSRVDCGVTDLQSYANRLYSFININGLPDNTYSTWINQWTDAKLSVSSVNQIFNSGGLTAFSEGAKV